MVIIKHLILLLLLFGTQESFAQTSYTTQLNIEYGIADSQSLKLDAFVPDVSPTSATALRPCILLVHGGGWSGGDRAAFHSFAKWFAERGFVSFSAGYRLVKGTKNTWPAQLDDVQLAVRWIRENAGKYQVNPKLIGAIGGSAGGHLVSMLATRDTRATESVALSKHSSKVACVVNWAGPSDLSGDFPTSATFGINVQALVDGLLGAPAAKRPEVAADASPINFVSANASPMLIVHGDIDNVVPLQQATRFHDALKAAGADSSLIVLKNEGHGLKPEHDALLRRESLKFFNRVFDELKESEKPSAMQ